MSVSERRLCGLCGQHYRVLSSKEGTHSILAAECEYQREKIRLALEIVRDALDNAEYLDPETWQQIRVEKEWLQDLRDILEGK